MVDNIILASSSPRRREILAEYGVNFEVVTKDVDESYDKSLAKEDIVSEIAIKKAVAVYKERQDKLVLAADTMVFLDDMVCGKPKDKEDAKRMLTAFSGKTHQVITGIAIIYNGRVISSFDSTDVVFKELSEEEIDNYLLDDEYKDKAGAYAIQGKASEFVEEIDGSMTNVIGLPIELVLQLLTDLDED